MLRLNQYYEKVSEKFGSWDQDKTQFKFLEVKTKMKKPKNLAQINGNDIDELLWWSIQLSISPEKLLAVINEVGNSTEVIKKNVVSGKPGLVPR